MGGWVDEIAAKFLPIGMFIWSYIKSNEKLRVFTYFFKNSPSLLISEHNERFQGDLPLSNHRSGWYEGFIFR